RALPSFPTRRSSDLIVPAGDVIVRAYRAAVPRFGVVPRNTIVTLGDRRTFRVFRTPAECHVRSTDFLIYYFGMVDGRETRAFSRDRKSTRLNSSHVK